MNGTTDFSGNENMSRVGLGYGIAIAVGILVLVSTIMLASYVCVRVHGNHTAAAAAAAAARRTSSSAAAAAGSSTMSMMMRSSSGVGGGGVGGESWTISGLDQATLESYPKIVYRSRQQQQQQQLQQGDDSAAQSSSCAICLADYRDGETLRMLPDCRHQFHVQCIDSWMRLQATCPMCRASPLPTPQATPLSTPLSELIPLARHPLQHQPRFS